MLTEYKIEKLEDGRTLLHLDAFNAYVLSEENLEDTLQEIGKLEDKLRPYSHVTVNISLLAGFVVLAMYLFLQRSMVFVIILTSLALLFASVPFFRVAILKKLYTTIIKDCGKIPKESRGAKMAKIGISIFAITFIIIYLIVFRFG